MKAWAMNFRAGACAVALAIGLLARAGAAAQHPAGTPSSGHPLLRMSPAEREIYQHATTLLDSTPQQIHDAPFLQNLRPAEDESELARILAGAGRAAMTEYADFREVECHEHIYSETSIKNPLVSYGAVARNATTEDFRYIIIPNRLGAEASFDEYRTDKKGRPVDITKLSNLRMITSNFTSDWLYFSPFDQTQSRFRYFGTQSIHKQECYVVGFAQNPATAQSVSVFSAGDETAVLLVQGIAWIDERSFHVLQVMTWLLAPRPDIGLLDEDTTANYYAVRPEGLAKALWVPHDVMVTIYLPAGYVRNTHRYSKYRVFRVKSTISPAP